MNFDNAKNAQADILRQVLGYREIADTYSVDDEDYPVLEPQFEERVTGQLSENIRAGAGEDDDDGGDSARSEGGDLRGHWDRRSLIGIGIRPPRSSRREEDGRRRGEERRERAERPQDGFGIVLLVQRPSLMRSRLVRDAVALAAGEAEVHVTGPISAPGGIPGPRPRGPLEIGCSVGHPQTTAGTLGCFANLDANLGAISNAHVFAPGLFARAGDDSLAPGARDGGRQPADVFGALQRFVPIDYNQNGDNKVDCAWSQLHPNIAYNQFKLNGAGARGAHAQLTRNPAIVIEQDRVGKIGRTTGLTWGDVIAINTNVSVRMHAPGFSRPAAFSGQLTVAQAVGRFSQGGDSGAVLFTEDFDPAGLVFAGSSAPANGLFATFANPISLVLGALQVTL